MRICIVNHYAYAPDQGAGNRHYEFARELMAAGHHVVIVSCSFYHKERRDRYDWATGSFQRFERIEGVPYLWLRSTPYDSNGVRRWTNVIGFATNVLRSTRWLKAWGPDVIVGSSPDPLAAWASSVLARRLAIPFVYEVRDVWPDLLAGLGSIRENDMTYRALRWVDGRLSRRDEMVISVWPGALKRLSAGGRTRVEWIPNGSRFAADLAAWERPRGAAPGRSAACPGSAT
jgi:glycosyltransferase involved in cell wall biosynthesis